MKSLRINVSVLLLALGLSHAATIRAASDILTPSEGYRADDYLTEETFEAFSMIDADSALLCSAKTGLKVLNLYSGDVELDLGMVPSAYRSSNINPNDGSLYLWASFVEKSPLDDTYWVGLTNDGNDDDRIYQVTADGTWTHRASLMCNFDMKFFGSDMLVSANPGGIFSGENQIVCLDTSGDDNHTVVANVGGYSAGLGISVDQTKGGVYYATYLAPGANENTLFFLPNTDVQAAITSGLPLTLTENHHIYDTSLGAYDTEVDSAGHIIFNGNSTNYGVPGFIRLLDQENPDELIEIATSDPIDWLTQLDVQGDLLVEGGAAYAATWQGGITKITKLIPGDANRDGRVDGSDVTILAGHWQESDTQWADGDFNDDGKVDGSDVTILAGHWQESLENMPVTSVAVAVPEPSSIALAIMMLAAGLCSTRSFLVRR